jgi:anti-sigma factor RsiW
MKEDCKVNKDKMADHLFDGLNEQDREALDKHLAECPKCAEHFQKMKDERALLREFVEKVGSGTHRRKETMAEAIKRCDLSKRDRFASGWSVISLIPVTKLAAAAVLLIAVGFFAGRLVPGRPVDVDQLRTELESSLKSSIEEAVQDSLIEKVKQDRETALDRYYVKLKDELARQFGYEMNGLAVRTLAASEASTDRRFEQLIRLIEAVRAVDHRQIAKALHYIESNRLEDRIRLGQGLESLGAIREQELPITPTTN